MSRNPFIPATYNLTLQFQNVVIPPTRLSYSTTFSHLNVKMNLRQYPAFTLEKKVRHCDKTKWLQKGAFILSTQKVDTVN